MHGFEYFVPTEIVFGAGSTDKLPELLKKRGLSRVLVVYGGASAKKSGLLDRVFRLLDEAGVQYRALGGVQPNPRAALAREGVQLALESGAELILAVGGGSVIDTCKAIAHGAANPGTDIWEFWKRRALPDRPYKDKVVTDFSVIEHDADVFLVIETIGGCGAALEYVRRALAAGKHVVTANKQLIAEHGAELLALAKANGVSLLFEASVGGGIPVLHPLSQCLGANEIYEVRGILNGTTNFILTQMLEHGQSYEAALRDAQTRGYAEQDPTADVEGIDAGRKICILADMMFGKNVDPSRVSMTGISTITAEDAAFAESAGMKLRLLGRAVRQGQALTVFVSPHFIAGTQPLAPVSGVLNAVEVLGSSVGAVMFSGPGAGGPAPGPGPARDRGRTGAARRPRIPDAGPG